MRTDFTESVQPHLRRVDPVERLEAALERLNESEPTVRAWECIDVDSARAQAKKLALSEPSSKASPVWGHVLGVKDVIDVAGFPTKAGSKAWERNVTAKEDATVVARLRRAGCIILGKVKTTEFACIDPTDTTNPVNPRHTPGGSSSGSAAAVAAGSADIALGTQTAGSVCRPAAYCGVAAFKPSTGSTASKGVVPLARTFDTVGFFSRDIDLSIAAFRTVRSSNVVLGPPNRTSSWKHLVIGMIDDEYYRNCDGVLINALQAVRKVLEAGGATFVYVDPGCNFEELRIHHRTILYREAANVHASLLKRSEILGKHWRSFLEYGSTVTDEQYWSARDYVAEVKNRMAVAFSSVDFMLLPPTRDVAPEGLHSTGDAGLIVPWTIYGSPLAVLPIGQCPRGLPIAAMIAGQPWSDDRTAAFASSVEAEISNNRSGQAG